MAKATTFRSIVDLIHKAEDALVKKASQTDPLDRLITLRGIFYGTEWSLDYKVESKRSLAGAKIRNIGFFTYTGHSPVDPRPALGGTLFADLQGSQSIHDHSYGIDVGHVLIGMESRSSIFLRNAPLPGQGGTGVEIVTWLGDLGGGVASLARSRSTTPTPVKNIFNNTTSDYGVMDNLEGDIGGYLVACNTNPGGKPDFSSNKTIADVLGSYVPLGSDSQWITRAARFSKALGATISLKGITNTKTMIDNLSSKLYDFGVWYAATRWIPSGELLGKAAIDTCKHMKGAAVEVATVFVKTLSTGIVSPRNPIQAAAPYPAAIAAGPCESDLLNASAIDVSQVRKKLEGYANEAAKLFNNLAQ